jgi:hypothetical protein
VGDRSGFGHHLGGNGIGLLLESVRGIAHRHAAADVGARNRTAPLLHDMCQLVREHPPALYGLQTTGVVTEHDLVAHRVRPSRYGRRGLGCFGVGVDPHSRETRPEPAFHGRAQDRVERPPSTSADHVEHTRRVQHSSTLALPGGSRQRRPACRGGALQVVFGSRQLVARRAIAR